MASDKCGSTGKAVVIAAHGGSGATTVARALRLPEAPRVEAHSPLGGVGVVLTALTHGYGARSVIESVAGLPQQTPIALALTSTGWWTAPETRAMRRLLSDRLAVIVDLPWCWRWHDTATPSAATATRAWRAAALDLAASVDHITSEGVLL